MNAQATSLTVESGGPMGHPIRIARGRDLHYLIAGLRRRARLIVAVAAVLFLITLPFIFSITPQYESTVSVEVERASGNMVGLSQVEEERVQDDAALETEMQKMSSRLVVRRAVMDAGLAAAPELQTSPPSPFERVGAMLTGQSSAPEAASPAAPPTPEDIEHVVTRVIGGTKVERSGDSYVVDLSFQSTSAPLAARVANALATAYILTELDTRKQRTQRQLEATSAASAAEQANLEQIGQQQSAVAARSQLVQAGGLIAADENTQSLRKEEIRLSLEADQLSETLASMQAAMAQGRAIGVDGQVAALRRDLEQAQAELAQAEVRYGTLHPEVQRLQSELGKRREAVQRAMALATDETGRQLQTVRGNLRRVREALGRAESASVQASRQAVAVKGLERREESQETVTKELVGQQAALRARAGSELPAAVIVNEALPSSSPDYPNTKLVLLLAFGFAVCSGFAVAVLAEMLERGFSTAESVQAKLGLPVLGSVPTLNSTLRGHTKKRDLTPMEFVVKHPLSGFAEAFSMLRTTLFNAPTEQPIKVIGVTSSLPGEGKSTTAICLGRNSALIGMKVVVIDCDVRRPTRETVLENTSGVGLVEVLAGTASLDQALIRDPETGAFFLQLSNETVPPGLFHGRPMLNLLVELRRRFDVVILDLPPVLAIAEARVLASYADAVLFVVKWRSTHSKACEHALSQLDMSGAYLAGVVLTQADVQELARSGYGDSYHYYKAYSSYYLT